MYEKRIAVMGAGAMGTILGACLAQAGLNVELIDANPEHVAALNANGARVVGTVLWNTPVRARVPEEMEGLYDVVFLFVKQTHNQVALAQLTPHLHAGSAVCTLQNGIPEPSVAAAIGAERTLGAPVAWAGTLIAPGIVDSTAFPDTWRMSLGTLDGSITGAARDIQKILSIMCPTELVSNLAGIRWSKLLMNASFSGMSAVLGCTFGEVLDNCGALKCAQYAARECLQVARAQGIRLAEVWAGVDFEKSMDFSSEDERVATRGTYWLVFGNNRPGKASMLPDLQNGRKSEIDFINGAVSNSARKCGVAAPVNDSIVRVVKGIEQGRYEPRIDNLDLVLEACR